MESDRRMARCGAGSKTVSPQIEEAILPNRLLVHDCVQQPWILLAAFASRLGATSFASELSWIAISERRLSKRECLEGELNPHEPCGPTDFKSGASADSATQAGLFSMNYRDYRFRFFCVAYLSPMKSDHFHILQSLRLNHTL